MEMPKDYYSEFNVNDFINDDDFVTWVKYPEEEKVQYWNSLAETLADKKEIIEEAKNLVFLLSRPETVQNEDDLNRVWNNIQSNIHVADVPEKEPEYQSSSIYKLYVKFGAVAAAAIILIFTGLFISHQFEEKPVAPRMAVILPGTTGATLTLANGKKIQLSNAITGKIANQGGLSINKTRQGQLSYQSNTTIKNQGSLSDINKLSTANGQTYMLVLPDGSKVWLNASSSISYSPASIAQGKRMVKLDGEGYFEIAKDRKHPFVVETRSQNVQVLGTHFNVNAYSDEPAVTTTLLEGSVRLTVGKNTKMLVPGQQGKTLSGQIDISDADVDAVVDWKNGDFSLEHLNFKSAMRKIARWYNVEVIYEASVPDNIESGGWIARDRPLTSVLNAIQSSGLVKFKIDGRKIYVSE